SRHGHVKQPAFFMFMPRLAFVLRNGTLVAKLARERKQRLLVRAGERVGVRPKDEDMVPLEPLCSVRRHQANGVFIPRGHWNRAARLAKILQVIEKLSQLLRLGDGFALPTLKKLQNRLKRTRTAIQTEAARDDFRGRPALGVSLVDILAC